jgi:iron complex outermembrane recepter protein
MVLLSRFFRALVPAIAWAAGMLLGTRDASAQTPVPDTPALKRLTLKQLGEIEITSVSKTPEAVWNTPAAIFVLTNEDIARSGATSIPDVLRLVPGVEVARIDTSRNWVVGIRGFGDQFSKSVLVLIDGRSAYTPLWAGVHWPIQDTLLEDVDRIEVIRGPGGTIWGANAQNGVINIITKSARLTHGVYASGLVGNVDEAIGGLRVGGGRGNWDYRAYAKGSRRAPQYHVDGREYDTWGMGQVGARLDWRRRDDEVTVSTDAYVAQLGESVRVSTFNPPAAALVDDPVDLHGFNVLAAWRRAHSTGASWRIQAYVDSTYRLGTDFGERRTTVDIDAIRQQAPWGAHTVSWGLGARTSPSRIIQTYAFSDFEPHAHTLNWFSAFVQDTIALRPRRLTVTGGAKLEHNTYSGLDLQPSARVLWTPSEQQSVWGGVSRAVRTPSRVDEDIRVSILARVDPLLYGVIRGNRELEPEEVVALEAGYRRLVLPSLYVDVSAFRNRYDELVDLGPPASRDAVTEGVPYSALDFPWINGNEGTTTGFELAPSWQPAERVRVRGSYSYLHVDLEAKPGNVRPVTLAVLSGSSPAHQVTLQSLLTLPHGVQLDPVYRYVSRRGSIDVPAYHTADVRLGIPLGAQLQLSIVGQNLLQARHVEWAREPGPSVAIRRSVYARVTWRR